jgi:hypothetical protein
MKNETANDVEASEHDASAKEKNDSRRLGIKEFVLMLILITVVWALQKCISASLPGVKNVFAANEFDLEVEHA